MAAQLSRYLSSALERTFPSLSLSMKDCQSISSKPAELGSEALGIRGSAPRSLSEALQNAEDGKQGTPELAR